MACLKAEQANEQLGVCVQVQAKTKRREAEKNDFRVSIRERGQALIDANEGPRTTELVAGDWVPGEAGRRRMKQRRE